MAVAFTYIYELVVGDMKNAKSPFENSPPLWCKGGMWKKEHREREAKLGRKTKRYPSDLTDI
ncbi:hypothetical protein ACI2SZ_22700, partial [Ralstonia nicotianae]